MPKDFNGALNTNVWHDGLYNAYLLVRTIADNLALDTTFADKFRKDADLYHDKFVWTDIDVLNVRDFDINDTNVLAMEDKGHYKQQEIVVDQAKQIGFTVGPWLAKAAWQDEGSYGQFQSELEAMVDKTKKLYEQKMVQIYLGAVLESSVGMQSRTVVLPEDNNKEVQNRLQAQTISTEIANVYDILKDPATDNNDNGFWHSFRPEDFEVVFNTQYRNRIMKLDLPTMFDNAGIKSTFAGEGLLSKYFGKLTAASVKTTGASNTTIRSIDEIDVEDSTGKKYHVKPGELLPANVTLSDGTNIKIPTVTEDPKIICKIIHREGIVYLSAINTSTEFFNAKNTTRNRYLTYSFAKPEYLKAYPIVTIREA